jgi:hypothetical protein
MKKNLEFTPEDRAAGRPVPGSPEHNVFMAKIDKLSDTWDADPDLQKKHGGNFYVFLAEHIRKKEASK